MLSLEIRITSAVAVGLELCSNIMTNLCLLNRTINEITINNDNNGNDSNSKNKKDSITIKASNVKMHMSMSKNE